MEYLLSTIWKLFRQTKTCTAKSLNICVSGSLLFGFIFLICISQMFLFQPSSNKSLKKAGTERTYLRNTY